MSKRNVVTTGVMFLIVSLVIAVSQLEPGGQRILIGAALALPWAAGGVAILRWPRVGLWLGLVIAAISLAVAGWIMSLANVAEGRAIAELLFASSDGYFTWSGVFVLTFLFAIAAAWCAGATIWLLLHRRRRGELAAMAVGEG